MTKRRRRALTFALVVAAGLAVFSFTGRGDSRPTPRRASASELRAFVARAAAGLEAPVPGPYRVARAGGGTATLTGPALGRTLVAGLTAAASADRGGTTFTVTRTVAGRSTRCLQFGAAPHTVGSVCLTSRDVIAFYELPTALTHIEYRIATLTS